MEALANASADALAANARRWLGNLHPAGQQAFRSWLLTVRAWRSQRPSQAGPALLAEGVLFDCLGRVVGLNTGFSHGLAVDPRFNDLGTPDRLDVAAKRFDEAWQADSRLEEAKFRAARIRALKGGKAVLALEEIAESSADDLAYLAAVSRASIAQKKGDVAIAARWFEKALARRGRSTASVVGLIAVRPGVPANVEIMDADDLYYNYPCRILTPDVAAELNRRLALPLK